MIRWLFFILLSFAAINCISQKKDTLRIFYPINTDVPDTARLDSFITSLHGIITQIEITGYADFLSSSNHNMALSKRRADNVKSYLTKKTNFFEIISCEGKGELNSATKNSKGEPFHRRVDVVFNSKLFIHEEISDHPTSKTDSFEVNDEKLERSIEELKIGESMSIEGLSFIPGEHYPMKESIPVLKKLLKTLQKNTHLKIEIQGHVCCTKNAEDGYDLSTGDKKLSENRAKYVYDYLVKEGVDPERLRYKGYARTMPKAPFEKNSAEEQMNRRVEIKILEK